MKKLVLFSFGLFISVLAAIAMLNFDGSAIESIEKGMARFTITKPDGLDNKLFLDIVAEGLEDSETDIMFRVITVEEEKPLYKYYKTNNSTDFLDIKTEKGSLMLERSESAATTEQKNFNTYRVAMPSLSQEIAFFNWYDAEKEDLSNGFFLAEQGKLNNISKNISKLGMEITVDNSIILSANYSFLMFGFVPAFLFLISIVFHMLSLSKKNVLRRIDGYTTKQIFFEELKQSLPFFFFVFISVIGICLLIALVLFKYSFTLFIEKSLGYLAILFVCVLFCLLAAYLVILVQRKITHSKGRVPRNGIYNFAVMSKLVIIIFTLFFISIAIRNVSLTFNAYKTVKNLSDRVYGYYTLPIYANNAMIDKEKENLYLDFYKKTVSKYNGILVDSSNYNYDTMNGQTTREEYAHENRDYISVNRNYLTFNPIKDTNGKYIDVSSLPTNKLNLFIPEEKKTLAKIYGDKVQAWHSRPVNVIIYDGSSSEVCSFNPRANAGIGIIDKPIIVLLEIDDLTAGEVFAYISQGEYFIMPHTDDPQSEIYPLLESIGISNTSPELCKVSDNYNLAIQSELHMLSVYGTQAAFLLICLFSLIVFTASLYCDNYRVRIAACIIEGYSLFQCIKGHLMVMLFTYLISLIVLGFMSIAGIFSISKEILLLPVTLLIDVMLTILLCKYYSTKNLYSVMKGAD